MRGHLFVQKVGSLTFFLHLQSFYSYPLWEYPQYTHTSSFGPTQLSLLAHNIIFHLFCTNRNKQTDSSHALGLWSQVKRIIYCQFVTCRREMAIKLWLDSEIIHYKLTYMLTLILISHNLGPPHVFSGVVWQAWPSNQKHIQIIMTIPKLNGLVFKNGSFWPCGLIEIKNTYIWKWDFSHSK